jgi:hypothetical protein
MIIYSSIFGMDDLAIEDNQYKHKDLKYVMFTDKNIKSNTWEIIKAPKTDPDPRRCSKYHKILPHKVLTQRGYKDDISIWIDGNVIVKKNPKKLITQLDNTDIAMFEHPDSNDIYYAFRRCLDFFRDDPEKLTKQLEKYKTYGIKPNSGLLYGRIILRRHNNKSALLLASKWWNEICQLSIRDQLSLPYVMTKNKIKINKIPYKIFSYYFSPCNITPKQQIKKIKKEINMLNNCRQYPKSVARIGILKRRMKRFEKKANS